MCLRLKSAAELLFSNVFSFLPHLILSLVYFSTATSLGRGGRQEGLSGPADAATVDLLWDDEGEQKVPSNGLNELPIFISTSGPLSFDEENTVKPWLPVLKFSQ